VNKLDIHIRLKEARKYLDLNQLKIAQDLNIKQKTVSEIENGKIMNIPNKYIYYFYEKGISLVWIYTGEGEMLRGDKSADSTKDTDAFFENKEKTNSQQFQSSIKKKTEPKVNSISPDNLDLLLNAKDQNIHSLMQYIHSQEKMIQFLQEIIRKELKLNP